jgi:hypothetical protein
MPPIAQAEVDALPGERMHHVRGIADQRQGAARRVPALPPQRNAALWTWPSAPSVPANAASSSHRKSPVGAEQAGGLGLRQGPHIELR